MKILAFIVTIAIIVSGALWYAIGGIALAISLGALVLILIIIGSVALGSWWSARLMERGAKIALIAQTSDDRRDIAQIGSLSGLLRDWTKLVKDQVQVEQPQYPALPGPQNNGNNSDAIEGEFRIKGFDE